MFWLAAGLLGMLANGSGSAGEVQIEGLEGEMLDNARKFLQIYRRKDDAKLSDRWLRRLHEDAPEQIRESLQPFGYYNATVTGSLEQDDAWIARYQVVPGPPTRVTDVDAAWRGEGADQAELQRALAQFPLRDGDIFVHRIYESGKADLQDAAYELGYVKVKPVEHLVRVDPAANTAEIRLILDTGPLYRFGAIRLHQDILDPDLLKHYVNLKPGQPYSNEALIQFQQGLISTGWFEVVEIKPDFESAAAAQVPIDVHFTPNQRHQVEFGLGYATDVGVRGSARWTNRRVNENGHQMGANLQLSPVRSILSGNYQIPVRNPRTDRLAFTSALEHEDANDTVRSTFNLEAAFTRTSLDKKNSFKLFGEYRYEQFTAGSDQDINTNLLSFGVVTSRTVAEEADFIRSGYNLSADLRAASSVLLSNTSFLRGDLSAIYLLPVGSHGRFNLRSQIGFAWVENFAKYPSSLRFEAGGDQSVRGYGYNSLGPRDAEGLSIGGRNLLVGSVEYDHRIVGKWVGAVFVDAGNAYNDDFDKIYVGAGGGVRWLAPFGSVRLDIGWPVSEDPEIGDLRVHLGLGAVL